MEPVLINYAKNTKEIYIESQKKILFIPVLVIRLFVIIAFAIFSVLFYNLNYSLFEPIVFTAFTIVFCAYPEIKIRINAKTNEKRLLMLYKEIPDSKNCFYDEKFVLINQSNNAEIDLDYHSIKAVFNGKTVYIILLDNKMVAYVDKNRFEKGNCEDFEKFIKEKATNAKIKL